MSIVRRDGRLFFHPYTLGTMPHHPTGYTGHAFYPDPRWWAVQVRYGLPDGRYGLGYTPRSRWRLVTLWHALRGHTEARP